MLTEYFRQKRIRRIRRFYSQLQAFGVVHVHGTPVDVIRRKTVLVSRDAVLHFCFTVFFLMLLGGVVSTVLSLVPMRDAGGVVRFAALLVSGVLAVECADAAMDRLTRAFDITFDYVLPVTVLLMLVAGSVGVRFFGMGPAWSSGFSAWRTETNQRLQSRPRTIAITPAAGANWFFARNAKGELLPLSRTDASLECEAKGAGWELFRGDSTFVPDPVPQIERPISVWMDGGFPKGQIGPSTGLGRPDVFSSAGPDDLAVTLCVKPEGR